MNANRAKKLLVALAILVTAGALTTGILLHQQRRRAAEQAALAERARDTLARVKAETAWSATAPPLANQQNRRQKPPLQDPTAREALALVGVDAVATEYWIAAINDPKLPDEERQDLIEDLNETGYTNNKRPTLEDLPLIETRIVLIEMLAPNAMDQVNADAFQEAYKDLTQMRARLLGLPDPPRRNLIPR